MRVLLIDDSPDIGPLVKACLSLCDVVQVYSLSEARESLKRHLYDLIIIDVRLPDGNGLDFCAELDASADPVPKLILSANNEISNKVLGLTSGAVDYICKPFHMSELKARLEVQLKQWMKLKNNNRRYGNFEFDDDFRSCYFLSSGEESGQKISIPLTPTELRMFLILLKHEDSVVSKDTFISQIWKEHGLNIAPRGVDSHIAHLRKKIAPFGAEISCTWGQGYKYKKAV